MPSGQCLAARCFNPRPRAGGDHRMPDVPPGTTGRFQSTPPRRGRPLRRDPTWHGRHSFNPRPRAGGDTRASPRCWSTEIGFNPRPREGGDVPVCRALDISLMFQSTPPRRGRLSRMHGRTAVRCFNPRPRAGATARCAASMPAAAMVSIHAPATRGDIGMASAAIVIASDAWFQSTPPRRGDMTPRRQRRHGFQSTPPRRGDDEVRRPVSRLVSIHAPARGAT